MLRNRLTLGLAPLLVLILATGAYSIMICRDLAGIFQRDLVAGYEASLAANRMRGDAVRMDNALAGLQTGSALSAQRALQEGREAFTRELMGQVHKAAGTARAPFLEAVDLAFQDYSARGELPGATASGPGLLKLLDDNEAAFNRVLAAIGSLERYDYAAARAAAARARRMARTTAELMAAVIAGSFLVSLILARRLVRAQRTIEATLHSTPDPLFVVGRDGRHELRNPAAEAIASGRDFARGFPEPLAAHVREVLAGGRHFLPTGYEHLIAIRMGREERYFLPRILAIGDGLTGYGRAAVLLQDVTRFRLLDDAKNNLVGTVSHELKTPLTSLRMAVYLLLEESLGRLAPAQIELLETARDEADRLLRILNDLLDLSRLESGVAGLNRRDVPVRELLEAMAREIRPITDGRGQKVEVRVDEGLATVSVDPDRIRHVFINLLANASAYSPEGSPITLYAQPADSGFVRCGVRDRGPGIPAESVGQIFEKFYRLPGTGSKGAGLGLTISREIVLAHGGTIGCASVPGEGSDFHFLLPGNTSHRADTKEG